MQNFVLIGETVAETWQFFYFFQLGIVLHLGFVMCMFGPSMTSVWFKSMQYFDNMQVLIGNKFGLTMPIHQDWSTCFCTAHPFTQTPKSHALQ